MFPEWISGSNWIHLFISIILFDCNLFPDFLLKTGFELVWQVLTMPLFRIIGAVFLSSCHGIVEKCRKEEEGSKGLDKKEDRNGDQAQE
jgi:hypothetical protein